MWQAKVLDTGKVTQPNLPRLKSVKSIGVPDFIMV